MVIEERILFDLPALSRFDPLHVVELVMDYGNRNRFSIV